MRAIELIAYDESEFELLLSKFMELGSLEAILPSAEQLSSHIRFYVEFAFHLAERVDCRIAIEMCDLMGLALGETAKPGDLGIILLAQAQLYDKLHVPMSRDLYAVEAAQEFIRSGRYRAAQTALQLVAA